MPYGSELNALPLSYLLYTSDWKFNCRDSSQAIFNKLKQIRNIRKSWNRNNLESFFWLQNSNKFVTILESQDAHLSRLLNMTPEADRRLQLT